LGAVELSLVVPCFNEESRLPASLPAVEAYLGQRGCGFEVVLVDDGSTDGTASFIREAERRQAHIHAVTLDRNRGKGRALVEGVARTQGALVLVSDADFSAPIQELPKLEAALAAGADVAIGSRAKRGAREVDQPWYRRLMGKVFNLIVQGLLLPGLWDTQCGFKLFRGPVARELFGKVRTAGFAYDVEVLYLARRSGYEVREVPVRWMNSATTRVDAFRHSGEMLRDILRIRFHR
jgi:dolichyl-phosphate beta-glucosyltransferase